MRVSVFFIIILALQLSSCVHHPETIVDWVIQDTSDIVDDSQLNCDTVEFAINCDTVELAVEECCCCGRRDHIHYANTIKNDPNFFRKIENGDTVAFVLFSKYIQDYTKREDVIKLIKYALLLAEKYHYTMGYHYAYWGYFKLYYLEHKLSDTDKKKLESYCWKSYEVYNDLAGIYELRHIYKGLLDPSWQDSVQYQYCDSIINHRKAVAATKRALFGGATSYNRN